VVERKIFSPHIHRLTGEHVHISRARNGLALSLAFAPAKGGTESDERSSGGSGVAPWPVCKAGNFSLAAAAADSASYTAFAGSRGRWRLLVLTTIHDPAPGRLLSADFWTGDDCRDDC